MRDWGSYVRNAVEHSDTGATSELKRANLEGSAAWSAHVDLFPAVQRVLNPPFINPHMPKMYAIIRDLRPYMETEDLPALLYLEAVEYARRKKLVLFKRPSDDGSSITSTPFMQVEEAIRSGDVESTASCFAAYVRQHGARELARRLLLIGSGYLVASLGHSISCTVFILKEMLTRNDQDHWPTLVLLADYFVKGRFYEAPSAYEGFTGAIPDYIKHATAGSSFVDIHHTITLYAIERARDLLTAGEYEHLVARWLEWMGEKKEAHAWSPAIAATAHDADYSTFFRSFSRFDRQAVLDMLLPFAGSPQGRKKLGRFLIKGL